MPHQIYLWEEGNIPTITEYTENSNSRYADPPGFRPNMVYFPAKQGVKVKGAVLVCGSHPLGIVPLTVLGFPCKDVVNYRRNRDEETLQ
jgi:hypothetical protein